MFGFLSFSFYGLQEFTSFGFKRNSLKDDFPEKNISYGAGINPGHKEVGQQDGHSKNIIITGINSGIGKQTALSLIKLEDKRIGKVYLVCRNKSGGAEVVEQMQQLISKKDSIAPELILKIVDLSLPKEINEFVSNLPDEPIDILINNAGSLLGERQVTIDGIESSFALNTLGTYYLTERLMPLLEKSKDARVITVSSGGMYNAALSTVDLESANKYDGALAYAQQKRAQVELTNFWAAAFPKVKFYSMHPGWVKTAGLSKSLPLFSSMMILSLRSPEEGCDTILFAALSEFVTRVSYPSGSFLFDRKVVPQHLKYANTNLGEKTEVVIKDLISKLQSYLNKILGQSNTISSS